MREAGSCSCRDVTGDLRIRTCRSSTVRSTRGSGGLAVSEAGLWERKGYGREKMAMLWTFYLP